MNPRPWPGPSILILLVVLTPRPAAGQTLSRCGDGCSPRALPCGGSLEGTLAEGDCLEDGRFIDVFLWQPDGPSEAELRVRAESFEPRLLVFAITDLIPCIPQREGDDSCAPGERGTTCVRYDAFPFPQLAFVTSAGEAMAGSYTIEATCGTFRCDPACRAGAATCGQASRGDLGAPPTCGLRGGGSFQNWDLRLDAPSRVSVTASGEAPLFASLHFASEFGGCGKLLDLSPCAGGACFEAVIDPGPFHLAVASPAPAGAYDLTVTCEPFNACASCPAGSTIACGETKSGTLGPEDCEVLFRSDPDVFRTRTERWVFDVPAAGLYRVTAAAPGASLSVRVVKPDDCSPANQGFPEPCVGPVEGACALFTLAPGRQWIEVLQGAGVPAPPPLEYRLEVTCVDLGPCEDCVRETIACAGMARGALGEGDCRGDGGAFLDILALDIVPGPPRDMTITARSPAFAPRLVLLDRLCGELTASEACEGAPAGSACLTRSAGFGGKFFLGVTADAAAAAGSYELEVSCTPFVPCASRCQRGTVRPGNAVAGELGADDCTDGALFNETWMLAVEAAGSFVISLETGPPGATFQLLGEDCASPLGFVEGPPGSQRGIFRLAPGAYHLVVAAGLPPPVQTLAYSLRVQALDCNACAAAPLACEPAGHIEGTLESGDCAGAGGFFQDAFTFDLPVMREATFSSPADFGSWLWLLGEDCAPIITFAPGSFLGVSRVLEAGKYTAVVTSLAAGASGRYDFQFACKPLSLCEPACAVGALECGKTATGTVGESDCSFFTSFFDAWRFDVPAAGPVVIDVRDPASAGFLSYGFLRSECTSFLPLADLCEFPPGGRAECQLEPGTYILTVQAPNFVVFQSGEQAYEVTVSTTACLAAARRLPGDCNQDSRSELGDVFCLLGYLFQGREVPFACDGSPGALGPTGLGLLDWDGSGRLSVVDAIRNLLYLFRGGPPHPLGTACVAAPGCADLCDG